MEGGDPIEEGKENLKAITMTLRQEAASQMKYTPSFVFISYFLRCNEQAMKLEGKKRIR
jgi:hypothetical protein